MKDNGITKILDELVAHHAIVSYDDEDPSGGGYLFLSLPDGQEMLLDVTPNTISLVGRGSQTLPVSASTTKLNTLLFVAASSINSWLTDHQQQLGRWQLDFSADTIESAMNMEGHGGFLFVYTLPGDLCNEAISRCLEKGVESFKESSRELNRFLEKAAQNADALAVEDALFEDAAIELELKALFESAAEEVYGGGGCL